MTFGQLLGAVVLVGGVVAAAAWRRKERLLAERVKSELRGLGECLAEAGHRVDHLECAIARGVDRPRLTLDELLIGVESMC